MYAETTLHPNAPSRSTAVHVTVILYAAAIIAAELLAWLGWRSANELLYVGLLAGLLHYYGLASEPVRRVLPALALAPLLKILSSTMVSPEIPVGLVPVLIGLPLLVAAGTALYAQGYTLSFANLTLTSPPVQVLLNVAAIPLGILLFYVVALPGDQVNALLWPGLWSVPLLFFLATVEEFVFRGVLHNALWETTGAASVVYGALIYALLGSSVFLGANGSLYQLGLNVGSLLLVGLVFSACRARGASLLALAIAHGLVLTTWLIIWPLVVA